MFKNLNIWFFSSLVVSIVVSIPIITVFTSFFDNTTNYFDILKSNKDSKYSEFEGYFLNFFNFCFELPLNSMIKEVKKFKY